MRIGKIVLAASIAAVLLGGNSITAKAEGVPTSETATVTDAVLGEQDAGEDISNVEGENDDTVIPLDINNSGNLDDKENTDDMDNTGEPVEPQIQHLTTLDGVDYSSVYDYEFYIARNPDVAAAFKGDETKTLWHFVNYGMREARRGNETFDVISYKNQYQDLRVAYGTNYQKYYIHL